MLFIIIVIFSRGKTGEHDCAGKESSSEWNLYMARMYVMKCSYIVLSSTFMVRQSALQWPLIHH